MRPAAKIGEIALFVERYAVIRKLADELYLVGFSAFLKERQGLSLGYVFSNDRGCRFCQLRHPLFDLHEIFRRERTLQIEVVVEPFLDRRTDGKLCLRKELLYGVRHQVRSTVPVHFVAFGRLERNDLDRGIVINGDGKILELTV